MQHSPWLNHCANIADLQSAIILLSCVSSLICIGTTQLEVLNQPSPYFCVDHRTQSDLCLFSPFLRSRFSCDCDSGVRGLGPCESELECVCVYADDITHLQRDNVHHHL